MEALFSEFLQSLESFTGIEVFDRLRKGDGIFVPITTLNRLPEYWGDDAEEFKCALFS